MIGKYLGTKLADAVEICDPPPASPNHEVVLTIDVTNGRKGVWEKVKDRVIDAARSLVDINAVDGLKRINFGATSGWVNKNLEQLTTGDKTTIAGWPWAIVSDSAATNLIVNPSFETDTASWSAVGSATLARSSSAKFVGDWGLRVTIPNSAGTHGVQHANITIGQNKPLMLSCWVFTSDRKKVRLRVDPYDSGNNPLVGAKTLTLTPDPQVWVRVWGGMTTPTNTSYVKVIIDAGGDINFTLDIDGVQLEETTQATIDDDRGPTSYVDGSVGTGYAWTGTAHASTSTRTAGVKYFKSPTAGAAIGVNGKSEAPLVHANAYVSVGLPEYLLRIWSYVAGTLLEAAGSNTNQSIELRPKGTGVVSLGRSGNSLRISGAGGSFPSSPTTNDFFFRTDENQLYRFTSTKWLRLNPTTAWRAHQTSSQSVTTDTAINWHSAPINDASAFDLTNDWWKAPYKCRVWAQAQVWCNNTGNALYWWTKLNRYTTGGSFIEGHTAASHSSNTNGCTAQVAAVFNMNENDYLKVYFSTNGSSKSTIGTAGESFFQGHVIQELE